MESLGPVLWLIIIGVFFFFMMRMGGCCGGGHGHRGSGTDAGPEHRHDEGPGHDHSKESGVSDQQYRKDEHRHRGGC